MLRICRSKFDMAAANMATEGITGKSLLDKYRILSHAGPRAPTEWAGYQLRCHLVIYYKALSTKPCGDFLPMCPRLNPKENRVATVLDLAPVRRRRRNMMLIMIFRGRGKLGTGGFMGGHGCWLMMESWRALSMNRIWNHWGCSYPETSLMAVIVTRLRASVSMKSQGLTRKLMCSSTRKTNLRLETLKLTQKLRTMRWQRMHSTGSSSSFLH